MPTKERYINNEEWLRWMKYHGWHHPTANDLIPTPSHILPTYEVIEYDQNA
jgi:hypothetical protein